MDPTIKWVLIGVAALYGVSLLAGIALTGAATGAVARLGDVADPELP